MPGVTPFIRTETGLMVPAEGGANGEQHTGIHGWYGAAWYKAPIPFGPSGNICQKTFNLNLGAGIQYVETSAVPAGEVWVMTSFSILFYSASVTQALAGMRSSTVDYHIYDALPLTSGRLYDRSVNLVMFPGDLLYMKLFGCTAGDDGYIYTLGYRMDIDQ